MKRSSRFATAAGAIAAIVLVAGLAGCGASSDAVLEALPPRTTVATTPAPTTTVEATTTTDATTTTEAPTTTAAPDTTEPSPGGSGSLPAAAREAFMESCQNGGPSAETCECIWSSIEDDIDIGDLMSAGSTGTLPADLEKKVREAAIGCITSSDA